MCGRIALFNQKPSVVDTDPGWIRIILVDPDPDRHPGHTDPDPALEWYQFQANEKVKTKKNQQISICCPKHKKIMTHFTLIRN